MPSGRLSASGNPEVRDPLWGGGHRSGPSTAAGPRGKQVQQVLPAITTIDPLPEARGSDATQHGPSEYYEEYCELNLLLAELPGDWRSRLSLCKTILGPTGDAELNVDDLDTFFAIEAQAMLKARALLGIDADDSASVAKEQDPEEQITLLNTKAFLGIDDSPQRGRGAGP
ncbi:unnamed protein product [Prorocentrum cordatum]|uniref:Uncharacterized protein n=1 Tax=Prorocentrum cordatum TaxID=2364126 RepID=A0ABN9QMM6_9DINO|nr:unnamed protein product [Polarella glacialis]